MGIWGLMGRVFASAIFTLALFYIALENRNLGLEIYGRNITLQNLGAVIFFL